MVETIFSGLQTLGVIASILFAAWQIGRNRRILEHDSYERLSREYQDLLWKRMNHEHLDAVWEDLNMKDEERLAHGLASGHRWGVWATMTKNERDCYRYTRAALEIFERAWQLHNSRYIDERTWRKWSAWMQTWRKSAYFHYVYSETRAQLLDEFCAWLDRAEASPLQANPDAKQARENI